MAANFWQSSHWSAADSANMRRARAFNVLMSAVSSFSVVSDRWVFTDKSRVYRSNPRDLELYSSRNDILLLRRYFMVSEASRRHARSHGHGFRC
jgi:hypothetical protein